VCITYEVRLTTSHQDPQLAILPSMTIHLSKNLSKTDSKIIQTFAHAPPLCSIVTRSPHILPHIFILKKWVKTHYNNDQNPNPLTLGGLGLSTIQLFSSSICILLPSFDFPLFLALLFPVFQRTLLFRSIF
jgi:hypothetical protein